MNTILPTTDGTHDEQDLLAAEYVLGVLPDAQRRQAEARIAREPAFAADVDAWETHFVPWLEAIAPTPVPDGLWQRISLSLWPASSRASMRTSPPAPSLWERLPFWRGLAAGGFAVAAASLVALLLSVQRTPTRTPGPAPVVVVPAPTQAAKPMVVSLHNDDGSMAYAATIDPDTGTITLMPVKLAGDPALAPELWLIPVGGQPHSLGMLPRDKAMQMQVPVALRGAIHAGTFAISLEPAGSHQHQAPTGPVVATGNGIAL